ncbi:nephrin-like isoform X3 [Mercenaria mercenaria]|uniref:nephrin-like isoform X3 n=1 Tax=Mercenaria mercenaria TaxID=6596 RepID=UPI00234F8B3C|nr:nephrin-like isoform X3 [Mercenaria mercenaria]
MESIQHMCNRVPLKPVLGGVRGVAHFITSHEQTQSNRVCYYCSWMHSLLPKDIFTDFITDKAGVVDFFLNGHQGQNPVTIDENTTIEFRCKIDSNPKSNITLYFMDNILKTTKDYALALAYTSQSAGCLQAGVYVCTGMNEYNYRKPSKKYLTINVKCFPRPSPTVKVRDRIFSSEQVPVTLSFTALAYPVPDISGYKWRRYNGSVWISLAVNDNIIINTSGLQSNLTILEVARTDYGMYRLDIENSIGIFEQMFTVGPEEKPYPPIDFEHIEDLKTESSFTVRWRPGLDGGPAQTFILRYKKVSAHTWVNVSIADKGEEHMNYTLSGLTSGSEYEIMIYSVNKLGRSATSGELRIRTKDIPRGIAKTTELPTMSIILGTLVALITIVILGMVVTIFVRRRLTNSRHNKRLITTKLFAYENVEYSKDENNESSRKETKQISVPGFMKELETSVHCRAKSLKPQLRQYEATDKGKDSIHAYGGLEEVTKRLDVDKRQSHMYESIEIVKGLDVEKRQSHKYESIEIANGEVLRPKIQQYEATDKGKGSIHAYGAFDEVTKRLDVDKGQSHKYESIEIVKDNKELQTHEKGIDDEINYSVENYENLL